MNHLSPVVDELFLQAVEQVKAEDWPKFIKEKCGGDQELESQLTRLLKSHSRSIPAIDRQNAASKLFWGGLGQTDGEISFSGATEYRLEERIGFGGHGVVFRAQQIRPLQRTVAIKLMLLPGGVQSVEDSMLRERQALQRLQHPGICQILDAGCSQFQEPFLVMEMVEGPWLTEYAAAEDLDLSRRLELFVQLCDAVHHAHQSNVIHRDLKPANVLVALSQGLPHVKVIDFGIAAIIAECGVVPCPKTLSSPGGTLEYMSPEQAGATEHPIGIATDVYALGLILFELLTGQRPFPQRTAVEAAHRPLASLFDPADVDALLVRFRRFAGGRREYSRERIDRLATILSMALRWRPDQRYLSVADFRSDVVDSPGHLPLKARPERQRDYNVRFFRTYRKPLLRTFLGVAAIVLGIVGGQAWLSERRFEHQRETERQAVDRSLLVNAMTNRILQDVLSRAASVERTGGDSPVEQALRSVGDLEREVLQGQRKEIQAQVRLNLAHAYLEGGLGELAKHAAEGVYAMSAHDEALKHQRIAAGCLLLSANLPQTSAEDALRFSAQVLEQIDPDDASISELRLQVMAERVKWLVLAGCLGEARDLLDQAVPLAEARMPPNDMTRWRLINDRLSLQIRGQEFQEAERSARHYLNLPVDQQCLIGSARMCILLADMMYGQGRVDQAIELLRQKIAAIEGRTLVDSTKGRRPSDEGKHSFTIPLWLQLARMLEVKGDLDAALLATEPVLDPIQVGSRPSELPWIFRASSLQGRVLVKQGRFADAEPRLRQSIAIVESGQPLTLASESIADAYAWLGICLNKLGRLDEAKQCIAAGVEVCRSIYGTDAEPTKQLELFQEKFAPRL